MWIRQTGALLACLMLGIGCNRNETAPTTAVRSTDSASAVVMPKGAAEPQTASDVPPPFSTVPVKSKDLTGVWYGVTRDTGVVVQFIGRQSREPDQRNVLSGEWIVDVARGSIGAAIEFTDNAESGSVDLAVGMFNNETKETFTASLGRVERSSDGGLYLTIFKNTSSDMYQPANRIRLQRVEGKDKIEPTVIEQMREARKQMQSA